MLDSLLPEGQLDHSQVSFIDTAEYTIPPTISRAPCLGRECIFETSIQLLPPELTKEVSMAEEMLYKARESFEILSAEYKQQYINHPPSHAVDGKDDTCFQSPTSMCILDFQMENHDICPDASEGDWISLDLVSRRSAGLTTINMIVDEETEMILTLAVVEVYIANGWVRR